MSRITTIDGKKYYWSPKRDENLLIPPQKKIKKHI